MTQTQKKLLFFALMALFFLFPTVRAGLLAALCALLLAALAEKPVTALEKRGVPRALGAALLYGVVLSALAALLWAVFSRLCRETNAFLRLSGELDPFWERLEALSGYLPNEVRQLALRGILLLEEKWSSLQQELITKITQWSAAFAAALPGKLLFLLIVLLSSAYAAIDWPQLCRHGRALLPEGWANACRTGGRLLLGGLRAWSFTQGKLLALQFILLCAALLALGVRRAPLWAALIAFADALPLLGAGSVLLPWALLAWLNGKALRGLCLCALAALLWAVRTVLEPRMLGRQAQLSPFYTVTALYLGLLCFGLLGIIAAPILLSVGIRLFRLLLKDRP